MQQTPSRVLVVEPDTAIRTLLVAVIRRIGLRVTAIGTPAETAAESARLNGYAAIILSNDMPRLDRFFRELRRHPDRVRPRIILLTTARSTPYDADADVILAKPFHLDELHSAIVKFCQDGGRPIPASGNLHQQ